MRQMLVLLASITLTAAVFADAEPGYRAIVEAEEEVYRFVDPKNGSGPFWCFGNTCIVRAGQDVVASGIETLPNAKPLNNTRWLLFRRTEQGWQPPQKDSTGRTREPSPLGVFPDGTVLLSANPTLAADAYAGPAQPQILRFSPKAAEPPQTILPKWQGKPEFTEHSYRSFAVDGPRREFILLQNIGYTHAEWAFCDAAGQWSAGKLTWPRGAEYAKPQPIRVCYPSVQLRDRAVYFCGVSDIVEPNEAWRAYKEQLTGQKWDYDIRRLFFTWTKDITTGKFNDWVEVASREKTCGWILPCDLWADADGTVHLLWTERAIDVRLRKQFFPNEKQSEALNYATIKNGVVTSRRAIVLVEEGDGQSPLPGRGRFIVTPQGKLFVFLVVQVRDAKGQRVPENRLVEIGRDGKLGPFVTVPLKTPLATFFTASVRAGCAPSNTLDLLGEVGTTVRYARARITE